MKKIISVYLKKDILDILKNYTNQYIGLSSIIGLMLSYVITDDEVLKDFLQKNPIVVQK